MKKVLFAFADIIALAACANKQTASDMCSHLQKKLFE